MRLNKYLNATAVSLVAALSVSKAYSQNHHFLVVPLVSASSLAKQIQLSSDFVQFPAIDLGNSTFKTVQLTNKSKEVQSISVGSIDAPYAVTSNNCNAVLAPGVSCSFEVSYVAAKNPGIQTIPISATPYGDIGLPVKAAEPLYDALVSNSVVFGTVLPGESSTRVLTIRNEGTKATALNINGLPSSVTSLGECSVLQPAQSCDIQLVWSPVSKETLGSITIAGSTATTTAEISGSSYMPANLTTTLAHQNFGVVYQGSSKSVSWTLQNTGELPADLTVTGLSSQLTKTGTCGTSLAGGQSCTLTLTWTAPGKVTLEGSFLVGQLPLSYSGTGEDTYIASYSFRSENISGHGILPPNIPYGQCGVITLNDIPSGVSLTGVSLVSQSGGIGVYLTLNSCMGRSPVGTAGRTIVVDLTSNGTISNVSLTLRLTYSNGMVATQTFTGISAMRLTN